MENLVRVGVADAAEESRIREARASSVWFSRVSASRNISTVASSGSMPPRSSARTASAPRTSCIDARFRELASVKSSVPFDITKRGEQQPGPDARLLVRLAPTQPAGDHQVKDEKQIVSKPDEDAFPGALNVLDGQARNRLDRRINRSQNERADELQMLEALADNVRPSASMYRTTSGSSGNDCLDILAFRWRESCNPWRSASTAAGRIPQAASKIGAGVPVSMRLLALLFAAILMTSTGAVSAQESPASTLSLRPRRLRRPRPRHRTRPG